MVGPWPHRPFTFRALFKTYRQKLLRCDVRRRYGRLNLAGLLDVDLSHQDVQLLEVRW